MASSGITEVAPGKWTDGSKVFQTFDGGVVMTTLTLPGDSRFDIETVHEERPGEDPVAFFMRVMATHIDEIKRKTDLLREKGLAAVEKPARN